jgi:hypothetical protein
MAVHVNAAAVIAPAPAANDNDDDGAPAVVAETSHRG